MKMVYSVEQENFEVMSCYRNETLVNEGWVSSSTACKEEYLVKYRDFFIIQETSLDAHIRDVINRFIQTGSVDKGKSPGRFSVSEEVDLRRLEQNPYTSLTQFLQQSGVPLATCS